MRALKIILSAFLLICVGGGMLYLWARPGPEPNVPTGLEGPEEHARRMRHEFSVRLHESQQSLYQLQYLIRTAHEGHVLANALFNINYRTQSLEEHLGQASEASDEIGEIKDQLREAEAHRIRVLRKHLSPDEGQELEAMQSFERRQRQLTEQYLQELSRCIVVNHALNELVEADDERHQKGQARFLPAVDRLMYYQQIERLYSMISMEGSIVCWGEDLGKDLPRFMPQSLILYGVAKELRSIHDSAETSSVIYRKTADKLNEMIVVSKVMKRSIRGEILPVIRQTMAATNAELN